MKGEIVDANFPRTPDGRVYHLGIRHGEVANRIITVGDPSRARRIAKYLDPHPPHFVLQSERGFLTITGRYKDTPISICAIGMGIANCDFFVREVRECLIGDMAIIRLGSCGALIPDLPVGSIAVPHACVSINRNYDYDFTTPLTDDVPTNAYRISKPVSASIPLHSKLLDSLRYAFTSENVEVRGDVINASADSFYSSQGRVTSFPDHNEHLIDELLAEVPGAATLEMESFHLFHLASVYPPPQDEVSAKESMTWPTANSLAPTRLAGEYTVLQGRPSDIFAKSHTVSKVPSTTGAIYASAAQMVFAQRKSQGFISPEQVVQREGKAGMACLETLIEFSPQRLHPEAGSVWNIGSNVAENSRV